MSDAPALLHTIIDTTDKRRKNFAYIRKHPYALGGDVLAKTVTALRLVGISPKDTSGYGFIPYNLPHRMLKNGKRNAAGIPQQR